MVKRKYVNRNGKSVLRARAIMEEHLNRELTFNECVHHINGIIDDDRIENLKVITRKEHTLGHHNCGKKEIFVDNRTNEERRDWAMRRWENMARTPKDDKI